jgi:hypothetical protein
MGAVEWVQDADSGRHRDRGVKGTWSRRDRAGRPGECVPQEKKPCGVVWSLGSRRHDTKEKTRAAQVARRMLGG